MDYDESNEYVQSVEADDPDLQLDSQDPEFIRGVEVGLMIQSSLLGLPIYLKIHASNAESVMRIADAYDMTFSAEETSDPDRMIVSLLPPEDEYIDDDEYYEE